MSIQSKTLTGALGSFSEKRKQNKNTKSHGGSVQCETKTESPEEKQFKGLKD